jgi:CheY-like chemotaxis protein
MPISKILVVDDVATDRMHLREILTDAGYQVITAASGREALSLANSD